MDESVHARLARATRTARSFPYIAKRSEGDPRYHEHENHAGGLRRGGQGADGEPRYDRGGGDRGRYQVLRNEGTHCIPLFTPLADRRKISFLLLARTRTRVTHPPGRCKFSPSALKKKKE